MSYRHWLAGVVLCVAGCGDPQRELTREGAPYTFIRTRGGDLEKIHYENRRGLAVAEGDIELGPVKRTAHRGAVAHSLAQRYWPGGIIPYRISADLKSPERVKKAIEHFESHTSLRFRERTDEEDFVTFRPDEELCSSSVGRVGGEQFVRLADDCGTGTVIHEIGHLVGLWHEQSREDRDEHLVVLWDNIDPEKHHNFKQHIDDGTDLGEYDYESVMHYGPTAFSANGKPTLTRPDGGTEGFGQRRTLSEGDVRAISRLYEES